MTILLPDLPEQKKKFRSAFTIQFLLHIEVTEKSNLTF